MLRNSVPGSATRVPAGRQILQCGIVALVFKAGADGCRVHPANEPHWKQTRCVKRLTAFCRNPFCFQDNL